MEEVYNNLDIVKSELDKLDLFKNIKESISKIKNNKELMSKIEKYNTTKDEILRLDIYNYDEIKEYKSLENEVNYLILEINQKLKKIKDRGGCCENN